MNHFIHVGPDGGYIGSFAWRNSDPAYTRGQFYTRQWGGPWGSVTRFSGWAGSYALVRLLVAL
jgi:hypothetical protein